ncbi:hypothetical protein AZE42_06457 [Rhizopogon vesiculosus]|uniref:Uncharacterized protein n=1 Tax=Rhizopogon vesiculosus TaxID=180088 RepID=A0A1J8QK56_9AGAM|nr:hypothetical protein AZE42_06457 [Rhizopogon vesiculosus]
MSPTSLCYATSSLQPYRLTDLETGEKSTLHICLVPNGGGWNCSASRKLRYLSKNARDQTTGCGDGEEGEYSGVITHQSLVGETASARAKNSPLTAARCLGQVSEYHRAARIHVRRRGEAHVIWRLSPHILLHSGSKHNLTLSLPPNKGRIPLGHPSLLTIATDNALTKHADLVSQSARQVHPCRCTYTHPCTPRYAHCMYVLGSAEGAQSEMMDAALKAARRSITVVRLNQRDPVVHGRTKQSALFPSIRDRTAYGIPVTKCIVVGCVVVCTGVGRQGKQAKLPGYERTRTVLILMGIARIE